MPDIEACLVDLQVRECRLAPGIPRAGFERQPSQFGVPLVRGQYFTQQARELLVVAGVAQQESPPFDDLGQGASGRADHWCAAARRLDYGKAEALLQRGERPDPGAIQQGRQVISVDRAEEADAVLKPEPTDLTSQAQARVPCAT